MNDHDRHNSNRVELPSTGQSSRASPQILQLMQTIPAGIREYYYGRGGATLFDEDLTQSVIDFVFEVSRPGLLRTAVEKSFLYDGSVSNSPLLTDDAAKKMSAMDRHLRVVYQAYRTRVPETIWKCCSRCCFAMLAGCFTDADIFAEVLRIHEMSELIHKRIERCDDVLDDRRKGVGGGDVCLVSSTSSGRDPDWLSEKRKAQIQLKNLVKEVLPFLYGQKQAPCGVGPIPRKLCSEAICNLLGVSRNFLYARQSVDKYDYLDGDALANLVDSAGVRLREHRRQGKRTGYPDLRDLPSYECGCVDPCFSSVPYMRLFREYEQFVALSRAEKPRRNEHRYLINEMFCPLMNTSVKICNRALAALYTVSEGLIADVRRVVNLMCDDASLTSEQAIAKSVRGYERDPQHPANRIDESIREKIELHLDMVLRADPGGSDGQNVCRVYSTEINTFDKLRKNIAEHLEKDEDADVYLSSSTLQRMISGYLKNRNCRISFNQSDHNACPTCKSLQVSILTFSFEIKSLKVKIGFLEQLPHPTEAERVGLVGAMAELDTKVYQEEEACRFMEQHNLRDAKIRKVLKQMIDYFITVERAYREEASEAPYGWCERPHHAIITHQDDMTKVDLPCFIKTASSDITRWRYDANAHVGAVTDEAIVFTHEQGSGAKNGSSVMETVLLDHLLRCKGEGIKVVVSDNASVGKNWFSVIAFPQYLVDQGLADVVIMVFLENNHGKWLADMLFGQLQIRRRSSTIVSPDGLMSEFESVKRKKGSVRGYILNPLSCVDFSSVLGSLGYQTTPPKDFNFTKRNVHFAAACKEGAKSSLPTELKQLIGEMLPDERGMVRICSDPPSGFTQQELPYESRYRDIPAAAVAHTSTYAGLLGSVPESEPSRSSGSSCAPLVVDYDKEHALHGPGVVSHRNTTHVGYNGLCFRKLAACSELHNIDNKIVREAWPSGLLHLQDGEHCEELIAGSESLKCAPENWVLREPVQRVGRNMNQIIARYPPRNMLNARYMRGPRDSTDWKPTATYYDPPTPIAPNTSSFSAMCALKEDFGSIEETVNVLDLLRCVFKCMGCREHLPDPWLQKRVTLPRLAAVEDYRRELSIFQKREKGSPSPPKSVKQLFKADREIDAAARKTQEETSPTTRKSVSKIKDIMFTEAEKIPGRLDRFVCLAAKQLNRYSIEMKHFKGVTQRQFDEANRLLPLERNV